MAVELVIKKGNKENLNAKGEKDSIWLTELLLITHAKRKPENILLIRGAPKQEFSKGYHRPQSWLVLKLYMFTCTVAFFKTYQ